MLGEIRETSMISNVKGKTEISPDLQDWRTPRRLFNTICLNSTFFFSLFGPCYWDHATRHPFAVPRSDKVSVTPHLRRPLQKIEFGSTRRPRNIISVALRLSHAQSPDGKARREDLHFGKSMYVYSFCFRLPESPREAWNRPVSCQLPAYTQRAFSQRQALPYSDFLSLTPDHARWPVARSSAEPAWRPRWAWFASACFVSWKSALAVLYRPIPVVRCTGRSNWLPGE